MGWLHVIEPGFLTTVQDLGRFGHAHIGISTGGAADPFSLRVGNRLLGNDDAAPALEMTLLGGRFRFEQETIFALTGADFGALLDGEAVTPWMAARAKAGAEIALGRARGGARAYFCVAGGFEADEFLGSASTDLRSGFGGIEGRRLRRGDRLRSGEAVGQPLRVDARPLRHYIGGARLRVTRGPQACLFAADTLQRLFEGTYTVRDDSDRHGLRLSGEAVPALREQLLTEGVSLGAVQVPPDGQPIILLVDQQTTGGYPKPANVILADLPRAGQLAPRGKVSFVEVDLATAHAALREQEERICAVLGVKA
jgi:antagonist of KipI